MYRGLQQSYSITSQDVLMAMDDCEESLQEIDLTSFLNTLCGHMSVFREGADAGQCPGDYPTPVKNSTTFIIGDGEEHERPGERAAFISLPRFGLLLPCGVTHPQTCAGMIPAIMVCGYLLLK